MENSVDETKTLNLDELTSMNIEMADTILQELLPCLGEIPVLKIASTLGNAFKKYRESNLLIKLLKFSNECSDITEEEIKEFNRKYIDGKEEKVGYLFIQILDTLDRDEKATIIGKLYKHCVKNKIELKIFLRLCKMVSQCFFEDLEDLKIFREREKIYDKNMLVDQEVLESLNNIGFISGNGYDGGGFKQEDEAGTEYILNRYGKILLDIL